MSDADEVRALDLLRAQPDKQYSLCDALSFVIMERLEITSAIAFDRHFRQYGRFRFFPDPGCDYTAAVTARGLALLLICGCAGHRLSAVDAEDVEPRLEEARESAPAVAMAAVSPGGIRTWVRGEADLASGAAAGADTAFLWFSVTKIVTATAVMQLVERGKVGLDDEVRRHVPWFAEVENPYRTAVTVRHLLAHASGLPNPIPVSWIHLVDEPAPELAAFTRGLLRKHRRLDFEPGSRFRYSNLGYLVLGVLVERASGEPFEVYVREHLLAPLRMQHSGFATPPGTVVATGYSRRLSFMGLAAPLLLDTRFFGETRRGFTELRPFRVDGAPYGGLVATVGDMARFLAAHLGGGELDGARVLQPATVALMQEAQRTPGGDAMPMGLGWHLREVGGERYAYHVGGGGGFKAEIGIYPDAARAVAVVGSETSFDTTALSRVRVR